MNRVERWWRAEVKLPWLDHPMSLGPFGITVYPGETCTATASAKSWPVQEWFVHGMRRKTKWLEFVSDKVLLEEQSGWFNFVVRGKQDIVEIRREN